MRGLANLVQDLLADVRQGQLQDADGVTAVGHRGEHPLSVPGVGGLHQLLGTQHLFVDAAGQLDLIGVEAGPRGDPLVDPHHLPASDADEQERHRPRVEPVA